MKHALLIQKLLTTDLKKNSDFPGGPMVRNQPANAGNMGSIPWSRKTPHALVSKPTNHDYGSLCPLEPLLPQQSSHQDEKQSSA